MSNEVKNCADDYIKKQFKAEVKKSGNLGAKVALENLRLFE